MVLSENLRNLAEQSVQEFQLPGLTLAVALRAEPVSYLFVGTDAAGVLLDEKSLFPVASITKLATALSILRLADLGALDLHDPVSLYLPDAAAAQPGVDVRSLLTHTSGLPSSYPEEPEIYKLGLTWQRIGEACLRTPLAQPPYTSLVYGGVGYALLALVVERITGQTFASALSDLVFVPLGIEGYLAVEPPRTPAKVDVGNSIFTGTPLEFYNSSFFRSLGEPSAGLMTTAAGVLALVGAFRSSQSTFLKAETAAAAIQNQVGSLGGGVPGWFTLEHCPWGLGPTLYDARPEWWPDASPPLFGHGGATGCVVWCDPDADVALAILGNKVSDSGWGDIVFPRIGSALLAMLH